MIRLFTKNATGVAPDGRWYAGDVNAFQDVVAALTDLTQTIALGIIKIGENGLQLLRYGAGEARLTGALRTDGILRALGGLYAGAFTTTARDAIGVGLAPYGLVILNTTINQLQMNIGTDGARNWQNIPLGVLGPWNTADLVDGAVTTAKLAANAVTAAKITDGTVTTAKLDAAVPLVPVGACVEWPWGSGSIPAWTALPYGQALAKAAYPTLDTIAAADGYIYGSTVANLNLPDERGRVSVGKDDMGGAAANRITVAISGVSGATLGATFGAEGITLTTGQLPPHNHGVTGAPSVTDPQHNHTQNAHGHHLTLEGYSFVNTASGAFVTGSGAAPQGGSNDTANTVATNNPAATGVTVSAGTLGTANAGSGSAHQNTQPSIIVNKIMRLL